ncbi:MAG: hypothetical protein Q6M04_12175 [Thermostichus sp. BF3_bins_97]
MSGFDASAGSRRSPWVSSRQARQADSLLDELFDDLEHSLDEGLAEVEEYPYFGTRPPLRSRRSQSSGGMLLGMALAATFVAGLAFWMTLRPRPVVFSEAARPWLTHSTEGDPSTEAPVSLVVQEPSLTSASEEPPEESPVEPESSTATPDSKPVTAPAVVASAPPPAAVVPAPPVPVRIPPQPVPQMKLVGLIHDPGAPKALILIDNVVRQVPVGQAVKAEWRVTSISPYGVGVSNGAQSVTLQLGLSQQI